MSSAAASAGQPADPVLDALPAAERTRAASSATRAAGLEVTHRRVGGTR